MTNSSEWKSTYDRVRVDQARSAIATTIPPCPAGLGEHRRTQTRYRFAIHPGQHARSIVETVAYHQRTRERTTNRMTSPLPSKRRPLISLWDPYAADPPRPVPPVNSPPAPSLDWLNSIRFASDDDGHQREATQHRPRLPQQPLPPPPPPPPAAAPEAPPIEPPPPLPGTEDSSIEAVLGLPAVPGLSEKEKFDILLEQTEILASIEQSRQLRSDFELARQLQIREERGAAAGRHGRDVPRRQYDYQAGQQRNRGWGASRRNGDCSSGRLLPEIV